MTIKWKLFSVGLHILVLTHFVNTFVLLTANMEDIKKLARKFVSESIAEKIADLLVKVTQNSSNTINISDENEMMDDSHKFSEENNKFNTGKQESDSQENVKREESIVRDKEINLKKTHVTHLVSNEEPKRTNKFLRESKRKRKPQYPAQLDGKSMYAPTENHPAIIKQYSYPLEEKPDTVPKVNEGEHKYVEMKPMTKNYANPASLTELHHTTSKFAKIYPYIKDEKPTKKERKMKHGSGSFRLLAHGDSLENNEVAELTELNNTNKTLDLEFVTITTEAINMMMPIDLTSKKALYEFDQYENKNYPKDDFLAPIGALPLRKMPKEHFHPWWKKEPSNDSENRRKSWF